MHETLSSDDSQIIYEPRIPFTKKDISEVSETKYLLAERQFLSAEMAFLNAAEMQFFNALLFFLDKFKIDVSLQERVNKQQGRESQARAEVQTELIETHFPYLKDIARMYPEFSLRDYMMGAAPWRKKTIQEMQVKLTSNEKEESVPKKRRFPLPLIKRTKKKSEQTLTQTSQDTAKPEPPILSLSPFTVDIPLELQALFPRTEDGKLPQHTEDTGARIPSLVAYTLKYFNLMTHHLDTSVIAEDGRTFQDILDAKKMELLKRFVSLGFSLGNKQTLFSEEDFQLYQKLSRDKRGLLGNGDDPESKISAGEWLEHFYDTHDMEAIPGDVKKDLSRFLFYRARAIQHCSRMRRRHWGVEVRHARTPQEVIFEHVMEFQQIEQTLQERQVIKMDESTRGMKRMVSGKLDKNDLIELLEEQADWLYHFCAAPVNHKWVAEGKKKQEVTIPIGLAEIIEKVREKETILFGRTSQIIETFYGTKKKNREKKKKH